MIRILASLSQITIAVLMLVAIVGGCKTNRPSEAVLAKASEDSASGRLEYEEFARDLQVAVDEQRRLEKAQADLEAKLELANARIEQVTAALDAERARMMALRLDSATAERYAEEYLNSLKRGKAAAAEESKRPRAAEKNERIDARQIAMRIEERAKTFKESDSRFAKCQQLSYVLRTPSPMGELPGSGARQLPKEAVSEVLTNSGLLSSVEFSTVTEGRPSTGATIKLKLLHRSDVETLPQQTRCKRSVQIGIYYIWAERGGVATSSKTNYYTITDERQTVELEEKRQAW